MTPPSDVDAGQDLPGHPLPSGLRRGATAALGPLLAIVLTELRLGADGYPPALDERLSLLAVVVAAAYSLSAALEAVSPRAGRRLQEGAILAFWLLAAPALVHRPALALGLFLLGGGAIAWTRLERLLRPGALGGGAARRSEREAAGVVQGAAVAGIAGWVLAAPGELAGAPLAWGGAFTALGIPLLLGVAWAWTTRRARRARWRSLSGVALLAVGCAVVLAPLRLAWATVPLVVAVGVHAITAWRQRHAIPWEVESWYEPLLHEPARLLVSTFAACGLLGGFVLSLPVCTTRPISSLDAFFTSFSATCVTGLAVLDTPNDFSGLGQGVILALIQVGGLGIMTFSTAALVLFGRRLSLRHEATVSRLLSNEDRSNLEAAVRQVLAITLVSEAVGALILTSLFAAQGDSASTAVWRGVFTAVSAFCNAGFALQSASLIRYQSSAAILHVVAVLIIIGGLGPVTIAALPRLLRRRRAGPNVTLILAVSGALLLLPAAFIAVAEWYHGLGPLPGVADKLHNAWFQSVTLRTAGFNSVELAALRPATVTVMMLIMFVGGSPGSTAGGIKTVTAALVLLAVWAAVRGRDHVQVLGVRVTQGSIYNALAVVVMGALSVVAALCALQLTQAIELGPALFEVVSALGTVGLSLGATTELDSVGKVIIMICMFAGRVGPVTLFVFLAQREERGLPWLRPEQDLAVG